MKRSDFNSALGDTLWFGKANLYASPVEIQNREVRFICVRWMDGERVLALDTTNGPQIVVAKFEDVELQRPNNIYPTNGSMVERAHWLHRNVGIGKVEWVSYWYDDQSTMDRVMVQYTGSKDWGQGWNLQLVSPDELEQLCWDYQGQRDGKWELDCETGAVRFIASAYMSDPELIIEDEDNGFID